MRSDPRALRALVSSGAWRGCLAWLACIASSTSGCRSRAGSGPDGTEAGAADAASASSSPAAAPPADASFLHMNSVPPSTVLLDEKLVGATPIEKLQVTPGKHVVVFELPDKSAKRTVAVDVARGATKAVVVRLRD